VLSLAELSLDKDLAAVSALAASLNYLKSVQKTELENIKSIDYYGESSFMRLDVSTLRNLEITETMRNREKRGSLCLKDWRECPFPSSPPLWAL
jgi:DNA mismatch repair protein MutS